jgi:lipopolysaccharide transport system permease protein
MVGVIEGFRWALLGNNAPDPTLMAGSYIVLIAVVMAGTVYFRLLERQFADVI